jgi:thiol peroxidase
MAVERHGAVTFKGNPLTLLGPELKVGDKAPNFKVLDSGLNEVALDNFAGKVKLILSVPSLDTPVCSEETSRFNREIPNLPGNVAAMAVSVDLPFAQARWCGASNVDQVTTLSDHRDLSFGLNYGTAIKELRLLSRAVFVIDENDILRYIEYVPEVTEHPNYDAALAAVREVAG